MKERLLLSFIRKSFSFYRCTRLVALLKGLLCFYKIRKGSWSKAVTRKNQKADE